MFDSLDLMLSISAVLSVLDFFSCRKAKECNFFGNIQDLMNSLELLELLGVVVEDWLYSFMSEVSFEPNLYVYKL